MFARPGYRWARLAGVDERDRRLAENEALFREVNDRVNESASRLGDPDMGYQYFCECANKDCTFRIVMKRDEYESVRDDPKQFVVLPDHYTPEIEVLVVESETFWVVRKLGEEGDYVADLDPRSHLS